MKPELILGLTLFWGGFCLCPNPVWAEDRIWLEGKINGQPVRLAFDTGAGGPVLFKQSAERLGLKFTPPSKETPTVPNEVRIGNTEYCEFTLAGDTHKMWFAVVDIPDYVYFAGQMDGVLGWGALGSDIYLIDASRSKMTALVVLPEQVKSWHQFRVQTNTDVLILEIPGAASTNTIFIDTGHNGGIGLAPDDWPAWKNQHPTQPLTLRAGYMPAAGVYVTEQAWADKISFGPLLLTDVPVSKAHATEIQYASVQATFGMAALKRMDLVVDGIKGIAYVNPKRQPAASYDHNRLGAVFVPANLESDCDLIAQVVAGGPAEKAGVRNGDVLLKVGDRDMTNWQTNRVKPAAFWEQPSGTEHRLTLRRGQQTNEVTVKLENILGPGAAFANAGNSAPISVQQKLQNIARQLLAAQIESQRKMLRQGVNARSESYDFSMEARRAFNEMTETLEFQAKWKKQSGDQSAAALELRRLAFEHMESSTNFRPAIAAWIKLSFSADASWESAHSLYRQVAIERPKDFLPKAATLIHTVQTRGEADAWFVLFKEAYASATQPKERELCLIILLSHAADLAELSGSKKQLQKLSAWLAALEKTESAERLPMRNEIGFIKFWVAFTQKDYLAAAKHAKDSRARALRPLLLLLAEKPTEARQALEKLSTDPKLSSQQRDILTSTRQILDEMKAAAPK
jgi:hypothetical protein